MFTRIRRASHLWHRPIWLLSCLLLALLLRSAAAEQTVRIERDVPATMRDGVILRADILRPEAQEKSPAILYRTPYGKEDAWKTHEFLIRAAREGYVVVVQDVRGRYASNGTFDPYRQESADGYDTVEWVAALPYCNGKVGMAGLSYPGAVQWLAAVASPPHLVTIAPSMCFSTGREFFYFGGAFDLSWIPWTALNIAPDARKRNRLGGPQSYEEAAREWEKNGQKWMRYTPLRELPLLRGVAPFFFDWLAHPDDGLYWDFARVEAQYEKVKVPTFNLSGWYDEGYGPPGAVRNFNGTRERGSEVVIGPWTHGSPSLTSTTLGQLDFGPNAGLDFDQVRLDWFDRHLKGEVGEEPHSPVRIFVMGENVWRDENEWPLARTRYTSYYFGSNHALLPVPPAVAQEPDRYVYDPRDPVVDPQWGRLGPYDQSPLERRRDVLTYTSAPLERDLEVTGPIEAELWVSSSAPDTDFFVRLLDVHPDGKAYNLMSPTLEVLRARYRNGESHPQLLTPGKPELLQFRRMMTSIVFKAGHRIRIHVTSSLLPHLDANPNTGHPIGVDSKTQKAAQTIYHDATRQSRIVLPVIPK